LKREKPRLDMLIPQQTIARRRFLSLDKTTSDVDKFSLPITSHFEYEKLFFYYINYRYLN
jgi:hypothetical protein